MGLVGRLLILAFQKDQAVDHSWCYGIEYYGGYEPYGYSDLTRQASCYQNDNPQGSGYQVIREWLSVSYYWRWL